MKVWLRKFNTFLGLSFEEKIVFFKTAYALAYISILLRLLNFDRFKKHFLNLRAFKSSALTESKYKKAIQNASQILPKVFTCLPQALAFKKQFSDSKLVIGVQPSQTKKLDAHAWVEREGQVLIGDVPNFKYLPLWIWE